MNGHGSHGGGAAPKARIPPEMAAFVAARLQPDDLAELDAVMADDKERSGYGVLAQNLDRAGALIRGERVGPRAVPTNNATRDYILRKQAEAATTPPPKPSDEDPDSPESQAETVRIGSTATGRALLDGLTQRGIRPTAKIIRSISPIPQVRQNLGDPEARTATDEQRAKKEAFEKEQGDRRRAFEAEQEELNRRSRERAAALSAGRQERRVDLAERTADEKRKAHTYLGPDFEFGESVPVGSVPDSTRAKLMDEAGLVNHVSDSAQRIRALLREHGPQVFGKAATEMSTLVEDLRLTLKDPVYNLGVLNGKDYELLSKVVSDPTALGQIAKDKAGIRDLDRALSTATGQWRAKVKQRMRGYGANPVAGGRYATKPAAAPAGQPAASGRVRVISPDGQRGTIDASELDAALSAGWRRADG